MSAMRGAQGRSVELTHIPEARASFLGRGLEPENRKAIPAFAGTGFFLSALLYSQPFRLKNR